MEAGYKAGEVLGEFSSQTVHKFGGYEGVGKLADYTREPHRGS